MRDFLYLHSFILSEQVFTDSVIMCGCIQKINIFNDTCLSVFFQVCIAAILFNLTRAHTNVAAAAKAVYIEHMAL